MPTPPVARSVSVRRKSEIEKWLRQGFSPFGVSGGLGSSVERAAKSLRLNAPLLARWVRKQVNDRKAGKEHFEPDWALWNQNVTRTGSAEPRKRDARRWILTAAQNDTPVHDKFWTNLRAYASHVGAEIIVGPFTYQLKSFTDHTARNNVFAEAVRPLLRFERAECGPLLFCAEMNTLPTAVRPLSGLHSYTRGRWGVFPHAKLALETVPAMPGHEPPIIMTTGCCTVENYIPKKAGLKAKFHHVIGATLVEIDYRGRVFCRQINALDDGTFQDLDCAVAGGKVKTGKRVMAINWGDIHERLIDPRVAHGAWGYDPVSRTAGVNSDSMIDALRPAYQFFNDLFHGQSISHWDENKPHKRYGLAVQGKLDVAQEVLHSAQFLRSTQRDFCRSVTVESNHDVWIERWLARADWQADLTNAEAYMRWNLAALQARREGDATFSVFRHVLREADPNGLEGIEFVPVGGSFEICRERGGIECGAHGHLGVNGSRGSTVNLSRVSKKINKGHDHTATIHDGVYSDGVCGDDPDLQKGPHTWTKTHTVTYDNAKRTLITMQEGEWRA